MEGEDCISQLDDEMILRILEFLPTVYAVRTVCVQRFRYLWRSLPSLSFVQCYFHHCGELVFDRMEFRQEFIDFVNGVLIRHDRPTLDSFHLSMEFCFTEIGPEMVNEDYGISPQRVSDIIGQWIRFALHKKVRVLILDFVGCRYHTELEVPESGYYDLPSIVLRSTSLVVLHLIRCCVKLFGGIQLKSLQILRLNRVGLSDEMVKQILSGCPLLEILLLEECWGLDRLKILEPTRLKKLFLFYLDMNELDIASSSVKCLNVSNLISNIISPTITHLFVDFQKAPMTFSDLPSIIEATVSYDRGHLIRDKEEWPSFRRLLQKLGNATCIELCVSSIGNFPDWESNQPCPALNWKRATTVLGFATWIIPGMSRFLWGSPRLESLVIYAFPFDADPDDAFQSEKMEASDFDAEDFWRSVGGENFDCLKHCLKDVTIQGCITKPYIVDCIEFLLGNALVLEKMVISSRSPQAQYKNYYFCATSLVKDPILPVSVDELSQLMSLFPKASERAEVLLT